MTTTVTDLGLPFDLWQHQSTTLSALMPALDGLGYCDLPVVAIPTGGGKTRIMVALAIACERLGLRLAIYTHRRMLTAQAAEVFDDFGVSFGLRAAGHKPALARDVQVCAMGTEASRSLSDDSRWSLHDADVVVVDEAHANLHATAQTIVASHVAGGARLVVGLTATPVACDAIFNRLVVGANNSDLRQCGAHVVCHSYAPDEPDLKHIRRNKTGEYTENAVRKAIMTPTIVGNVFAHWQRLNPDGRPTILFAPGVDESIWLVQQLKAKGVSARHIDAETSDAEREDIAGESRDGFCKIVSNRFVLREGVDWPWLYHGIFATAFGGVSNWLQSGGRLLRSDAGKLDHVICQDHGGNWHRHGSLNDDRPWRLDDDNKRIADRVISERKEQVAENSTEPICCPKCQRLRRPGRDICPGCGHTHKRSVRLIMQTDGELVRKVGRVTKHKPRPSDAQSAWNAAYYKNRGRDATFNQVAQQFVRIARGQHIEISAVPFHDDGRACLRNCPPADSVYWGLPISEWGKYE